MSLLRTTTCDALSVPSYEWQVAAGFMMLFFGSIVLERYFRFEISLLSILCMIIAQMEMGTRRVSGDSDIITQTTEHLVDGNDRVVSIMMM